MKANVGGIDRALRILVPLLTGVMSFCPFYPLLGLSTCPMKQQ
jgi:hypothetical protein